MAHCFGRGQADQHFNLMTPFNTPLCFDLSCVVLGCFLLSLLYAHAATDSFTVHMVMNSISCLYGMCLFPFFFVCILGFVSFQPFWLCLQYFCSRFLRVKVNQGKIPTKNKIQFDAYFWMLVNKIHKNVVCILVLRVKLHSQWIKVVEMRAKSV